MEKTRAVHGLTLGDAVVEGLLNGIFAGVVMALAVVALELVAGESPLNVLGYFDATAGSSPLTGALTHIAVSGIYGLVFGFIALARVRFPGAHPDMWFWLLAGLVYGILILGIAEWVILPRTGSALGTLPVWVLSTAHGVYGILLGWLTGRNK